MMIDEAAIGSGNWQVDFHVKVKREAVTYVEEPQISFGLFHVICFLLLLLFFLTKKIN